MTAIVSWFTTAGRTYRLQRWDTVLEEWGTVASDIAAASVPYTDSAGVAASLYRVCDDTEDPDLSPYTPQFYGHTPTPSTCTLYGYVYDIAGVPKASSTVQIRCKTLQDLNGNLFDRIGYQEVYTDSLGRWEQDIVRGLTVHVRIPDLDFSAQVVIPDQSSVDFSTLL